MNNQEKEQNHSENRNEELLPESNEIENINTREKAPVKKTSVRKRTVKKTVAQAMPINESDLVETKNETAVQTDHQQIENLIKEIIQEAAADESVQTGTKQENAFPEEDRQEDSFQPQSDHDAAIYPDGNEKDISENKKAEFLEHIQSAMNDKAEKEKEKKKDKKKKSSSAKSTLCKMVKKDYLKKHIMEYQDLVIHPHYICIKCGRTAHDKKYLCKPLKIM